MKVSAPRRSVVLTFVHMYPNFSLRAASSQVCSSSPKMAPPPPQPPALVSPAPLPPQPALPPWAVGPFLRRDDDQPIISPDPASTFFCPMRGADVHWESLHTFNPAAIEKDGKVFLLYRAEDDSGAMSIGMHTSRLGLAVSDDGVAFKRFPTPVLFPADDSQRENEWDGGCEDPRLVESADGPADNRYILTYTQWNRRVPRLAIATSPDLLHWTKRGPAFAKMAPASYHDMACKSGSIVCAVAPDGRLKAVRIRGSYLMYWGEGSVHLATSADLIGWHIVEDAPGKPTAVLSPQAGTFDSPLSECGPPALLTDKGIVFLYNAKNDGHQSIAGLAANAYAGTQALFSADQPTKLEARLAAPFLKPERAWERTGQYAAGTTFTEGLVLHRGRWMLYYGCADSRVGVVSAEAAPDTAAPATRSKP